MADSRKLILFVCTSNTCRSPMAEAFAKIWLANNDGAEDFQVQSRALSSDFEPEGSPASSQGVEVMREDYGLDTSSHKSQLLRKEDVLNAYLIVCVTRRHVDAIISRFPGPLNERKTVPMSAEIADPWHSSVAIYRECAGQLKECVDQVLRSHLPFSRSESSTKVKDSRKSGGGTGSSVRTFLHCVMLLIVLAVASSEDIHECNIERREVGAGEELILPVDRPLVFSIRETEGEGDGGGGGGGGDHASSRHEELSRMGSLDHMRAAHGHSMVKLSSSNAFSHHEREVPLSLYLDYMQAKDGDDNTNTNNDSDSGSDSGSDNDSDSNGEGEGEGEGGQPGEGTRRMERGRRVANETWYLFGNNENRPPFKELAALYQASLPSVKYAEAEAGVEEGGGGGDGGGGGGGGGGGIIVGQGGESISSPPLPPPPPLQQPSTVIGLGNNGSGLSFHFHGPGLSETVLGRKRWFLYPPWWEPPGGYARLVNTTLAEWVLSAQFGQCEPAGAPVPTMPMSANKETTTSSSTSSGGDPCFYDCSLGAGELVYFPAGWYHATLNQAHYTLFASVFL